MYPYSFVLYIEGMVFGIFIYAKRNGLALCVGGGMIGSVTKDECLVGGVFVCVGVLRFSLSLYCLCFFVCVFFMLHLFCLV